MRTVNNRTAFLDALNMYLPKDCYGVEIGTYRGDFAQMILDIINPKILYLIDPFKYGNERYKDGTLTSYSDYDDFSYVTERFLNNVGVFIYDKYSYEVCWRLEECSLDFIYIDGSHLYYDVKRDLNDWLPKLKQDGIMCLHDYIELDNFGVIQAVDEFIIEHNFEKIIFNDNGGDIALKRKI